MTAYRLALIAAASLAFATPAPAAQTTGPNPEVQATVDAALSAGMSGDVREMLDQYAPDCVFVDEFAPFLWTGPNAIQAYLASGFRMYRETRHKDDKPVFGPAFVYVSGDRAFVVEPVAGAANVKGEAYSARGAFAFTLAKLDGRWKITSQTWTKTAESFNPY